MTVSIQSLGPILINKVFQTWLVWVVQIMKTVCLILKKSWKLLHLLVNREVQTGIRKNQSCKVVQNSESKKEKNGLLYLATCAFSTESLFITCSRGLLTWSSSICTFLICFAAIFSIEICKRKVHWTSFLWKTKLNK